MDGLSGGAYPGDAKDQKDAKQKVNNAWQNYAAAINQAASIIGQFKSGDRAGGFGSLIDMLFPQLGGIGSALGNLAGVFGIGQKKSVVVEKIIEPVKIDNDDLSHHLSANPASALFGGRGMVGGAAYNGIQIGYKDGVDELIEVKVAGRVLNQSYSEGIV